MNKNTFLAAAAAVVLLTAATQKDDVISREGDTIVVNTTSLTSGVIGYMSTTPVKIYIKDGVVQRVEALPNQETPKYFNAAAKTVLPQWQGLKVKKARQQHIDGRTGATMSSDALIRNVQEGLDYYKANYKAGKVK